MKSGIYLNDFIFNQVLDVKSERNQKTLNRVYNKLIWLGLKTYVRLPEHSKRKLFEKEYWKIQQEIKDLPIDEGRLEFFVTFRISKETKQALAKIKNQSAFVRSKLMESTAQQ